MTAVLKRNPGGRGRDCLNSKQSVITKPSVITNPSIITNPNALTPIYGKFSTWHDDEKALDRLNDAKQRRDRAQAMESRI